MTDLFHPNAAGFRLDGTRGEAVVLVHGFTGTPAHFRPLGATLHEAGYTVMAPRLAGHGTSMEDMASTGRNDWVRSALAAYGEAARHHDRVHVGGLSMGGLISILLAAQLPVASLTTIDSPVLVRDPRSYVAPFVARWMPQITWDPEEEPDLDPEVVEFALTYPGFPTKCLGGLNRISLRAVAVAPQVSAPALVVQSRTDETVLPVSAEILANRLGGPTELRWLEASMHNAVIDRERHLIAEFVLAHVEEA